MPDWAAITAVATIISGLAVVGSLLAVAFQLQKQGQEDFVAATSSLFDTWLDDDFQRAMQWVLYDLTQCTWRTFLAAHRGKYGERAFIRVGSYFNRTGYLVTHKLMGGHEQYILDSVAGRAIEVWQKIEPLVLEARLVQNSTLFQDFQMMLPECYACYVPTQPIPLGIQEGAAGDASESASALSRDRR